MSKNSAWQRLRESTEGPMVTVQLPREWAEELLRSLATALEVEDMGGEPGGDDDMMGVPHMEPDADDLGGEPDFDMDDMFGGGGEGDSEEEPEEPAGDDDDEESDEDDSDEEEDDDEEEEQDESAGPYRPETAVGEKYLGFNKLKNKLARQEGKVRDPGALAASIGRKKYGKAKFQKAAASGKKLG